MTVVVIVLAGAQVPIYCPVQSLSHESLNLSYRPMSYANGSP